MKTKLFLAVLCLSFGLTAMAQNNNRQQRDMPRQQMDAVVDTSIINNMGLAPEMISSILELQTAKLAEQKSQMPSGKDLRKMNEEGRAQVEAKQQLFKSTYRVELRKIMGDAIYITYLEKQVDARRMNMAGFRRGQNNNSNNNRRGNFGGDDFGGGNMGGNMGGDF